MIPHNQEEVPVPRPITPGLDGEPASEYWSELHESDSDSDTDSESTDEYCPELIESDSEVNAESEYQEQIAGESDIEENEVRATTINVIRFQLPEEIFRALNNPVTRDFVLNALLSVVLPLPQAEMGAGDTEPTNGMGQEEMDAIPLVTIDGGPAEFEGQRTCSVCMEDFVVGELARKPRCNHLFHQTCLWPWLDLNRTCPSCRRLL